MNKIIILVVSGIIYLSISGIVTGQSLNTNYFHTLIQTPSFPSSIALQWEIKKEKYARVNFDEVEVERNLIVDYGRNKEIQNKYPDRNDFIAMVKSNILTSSNRIFRTSERITLSKYGRHLQISLLDNRPVSIEVLQISDRANKWKTLWIDHKQRVARMYKGEREIFSEYHETGLFDGSDRLLFVAFLLSLQDMDISSAIRTLCKDNFLSSKNQSMQIESNCEEIPPHYLLIYNNSDIPLTIKYTLDPFTPGLLLGKHSTYSASTSTWSFRRTPSKTNTNQKHMFPESAHIITTDPSGKLIEEEWRILKKIQSENDWDIQQIWAEKMDEIKNFNILEQP